MNVDWKTIAAAIGGSVLIAASVYYVGQTGAMGLVIHDVSAQHSYLSSVNSTEAQVARNLIGKAVAANQASRIQPKPVPYVY